MCEVSVVVLRIIIVFLLILARQNPRVYTRAMDAEKSADSTVTSDVGTEEASDSQGFTETTEEPSADALAEAVSELVIGPVPRPQVTAAEQDTQQPSGCDVTGKSASDSDYTAGECSTPTKTATDENKAKVSLLLKAVGDAPIMKQRLWMVEPEKPVTWVVQFIRRFIRLPPSESLFVFVSSAFSPAPDQTIGNLFHCFGSEGRLVLHYCKAQAWG